jgi:hypothetical protein
MPISVCHVVEQKGCNCNTDFVQFISNIIRGRRQWMEIYVPLHIHIYISLHETVHNIQPCFCASSLALAFSIFANLAADLEPRTPPPQCRFISSKRSLKLVLIASTTFVKAARSPESTYTEENYVTYCNMVQLHSYRWNSTNATKSHTQNRLYYTVITLQNSGWPVYVSHYKITHTLLTAISMSLYQTNIKGYKLQRTLCETSISNEKHPPRCDYIHEAYSCWSYLSYCNTRACLAPDKCPKTSFAFYYAVRNPHLAAKCW